MLSPGQGNLVANRTQERALRWSGETDADRVPDSYKRTSIYAAILRESLEQLLDLQKAIAKTCQNYNFAVGKTVTIPLLKYANFKHNETKMSTFQGWGLVECTVGENSRKRLRAQQLRGTSRRFG